MISENCGLQNFRPLLPHRGWPIGLCIGSQLTKRMICLRISHWTTSRSLYILLSDSSFPNLPLVCNSSFPNFPLGCSTDLKGTSVSENSLPPAASASVSSRSVTPEREPPLPVRVVGDFLHIIKATTSETATSPPTTPPTMPPILAGASPVFETTPVDGCSETFDVGRTLVEEVTVVLPKRLIIWFA